MPIADFVQHVGGLSQDSDGIRSLAIGLADAGALRTYAADHGIALSEAEASAIISAAQSPAPDSVRTLTDTDLDSVSGGGRDEGMPEGLSRVLDMIHSAVIPKDLPPGVPKKP